MIPSLYHVILQDACSDMQQAVTLTGCTELAMLSGLVCSKSEEACVSLHEVAASNTAFCFPDNLQHHWLAVVIPICTLRVVL